MADAKREARNEDLGEIVTSPGFRPSSTLSLVIVSYNRSRDLLECLAALDRQEHRDFEVLVVDNGGNEAAHALLPLHPVKWLRMAENRGATHGRNVGVAHAAGEVVVFLDDDCQAAPDLTAAMAEAFSDPAIYALRGRVLPKTG